jgi:metal-responsive CopG/Arc/MetJ family transcriptional regulator
MNNSTVRTTLSLPAELLKAADDAVKQGKAKSRNDFVAMALRRELAAIKRAEIDDAIALMANDSDYQAETETINSEFASSDWEALKIGEGQ